MVVLSFIIETLRPYFGSEEVTSSLFMYKVSPFVVFQVLIMRQYDKEEFLYNKKTKKRSDNLAFVDVYPTNVSSQFLAENYTLSFKIKMTLLQELAPLQQKVLEKIVYNEKHTPTCSSLV